MPTNSLDGSARMKGNQLLPSIHYAVFDDDMPSNIDMLATLLDRFADSGNSLPPEAVRQIASQVRSFALMADIENHEMKRLREIANAQQQHTFSLIADLTQPE